MANPGKKILLVDNYRSERTKSIEQIESAIKQAGYQVDTIRHSDAATAIKSGTDILNGYHGSVSSGSGKTWQKTGKTDKQGNDYVVSNDTVHEHLTSHEKPLYAICGGYHALAQSLGYKVTNTGEFNRGKGEDGQHYNHKYGLAAEETADGKVKNVETINHAGKEYVKSFDYENKRGVQYHPERTEIGRQELTDFLKKNVDNSGGKAKTIKLYQGDNYQSKAA